jgi:hypothetical protein
VAWIPWPRSLASLWRAHRHMSPKLLVPLTWSVAIGWLEREGSTTHVAELVGANKIQCRRQWTAERTAAPMAHVVAR